MNHQINNRNRRPMSNGGRIIDFSKYERKKVNGSEKYSNYNSNQDKNKQNLIPQNPIKYNYNKESEAIPKQQNYNCNRIKIDVSKYTNSSNKRVQNNSRIKLENKSPKEKALYEGPKYQLIGKDLPKDKPRPKTVSHSRNRSNKVRKQQQKRKIIEEKKGYIPFGGKGYRVGGAPVQIPRPNNNNRNRIPKPNEDKYNSIHIERNSSYTEISQRSSSNINNYNTIMSNNNSNIKGMRDFQRKSGNTRSNPNIRRNISANNYQRHSKNKIKIDDNENKFPGRGIRVGSSGINRSELISEKNNSISYAQYKKFEKDNMDMLEIAGKNDENIKCFEQSLFYHGEQNGLQNGFEKRFEENLCEREEREENEGVFKEIFCPVHGRQLIRIYDINN